MLTSVHFCLLLFLATRIIYSQTACSCELPNSDFANGVNFIHYNCNNVTPTTMTYNITAPQDILDVLDPNKRTIFYVFGFMNTPTDSNVKTMIKALCSGNTDNVVLLDWSKYNQHIDYPRVFKNAEKVGSLFARSLQLFKDEGFNTSTIYIIGHSVGAHISGLVGYCTNFTIPRITGLDPANRLWYPFGCYLAPTDASWVDVIHTDSGEWGTPKSMGTADYYANTGTVIQPGCPFNASSVLSIQGTRKPATNGILVEPDGGPATEKCSKARRSFQRAKKKKERTSKEVFEEALRCYREERYLLGKEIETAKRKAWKELLEELEKDPWERPYQIVLNKLTNSKNVCEELSVYRIERILEVLFPQNEDPNVNLLPRAVNVNLLNRAVDDSLLYYDEDANVIVDEENVEKETRMINEEELNIIVKRMMEKGHPAPEPDGVTNVTVGMLAKSAPEIVINMINTCLRECKIPDRWKLAKLVLMKKPGKPDGEPSSYRPLCLLNEIAKLMERVILHRIDTFIEERESKISDSQYGFIKGKSTIDAITTVKKIVQEGTREGKFCLACSIDIKNAFNSIPWKGINRMMRNRGFPKYLIKLIESYLSNCELIWINEEGNVQYYSMEKGVPQGSILGPRLWNLVYESVTNMRLIEEAYLTGYANDTIVMVRAGNLREAKIKLSIVVSSVIRKIRQLGLEIAAHKSEAIVFPPNDYKRWNKKVYIDMDNIRIKCSNVGIKYLGVTIDPFWNFNAHFSTVLNKANAVTYKLVALMKNLKGPSDHKRKLYANTIYAILLYGAPIWSNELEINKHAKKEVRKLQKKLALRIISGYRTVSYEAAEILAELPPVDLTAKKFKRVYDRKKEISRRGNGITERAVNVIKKQEEAALIRSWEERLHGGNLPGERIYLPTTLEHSSSLQQSIDRLTGTRNKEKIKLNEYQQ
ncbi:hypothetical protein DMN91_012961 [Ooceraea biroi]|uniref:Reverse transcriptase domain-containing protein n=1 Tax=Ooceraea biroi TaxID=2015173 RepID=A0A3L8D4C5_OOCBI|nr:hypothetical protein DMN91_012961 [Ooceraea biroi]